MPHDLVPLERRGVAVVEAAGDLWWARPHVRHVFQDRPGAECRAAPGSVGGQDYGNLNDQSVQPGHAGLELV